MTYRVVFSPTARGETLDTVRWLAQRSPAAAARWHEGLERAIAKIGTFPERHPVAEEESDLLGVTIRELLYGRRPSVFRVLFSVDGNTVYLHSVRHSARGPLGG